MIRYILFILFLSFGRQAFAAKLDLLAQLSPAGYLKASTSKVMGKLYGSRRYHNFKSDKIFILAKSLSTGIDLRDQHLKKYLKVNQYKYIKVSEIKVQNGKGVGVLHLMDKKKKIKFKVSKGEDEVLASFKLSLKSLQLEKPGFMGISVADELEINVLFSKEDVLWGE